jgi:hypothetical protein
MPEITEEQNAHSGLQSLFGQQDENGTLPLAGIRARARRQLTKFGTQITQELQAAGIECPPAISLTSGPQAGISLENEHPQAAAILKWLDGNVKVAKKFKEIEVLFEIVRAAENPGTTLPASACFHIGLTSAGAIAYFEEPSPAK